MMKKYLIKIYIVLLTQFIIIKGFQLNNSSSDVSRHPRGRIVKLYSGPKPEPITCNNEGFLAEPTDCSIFYRCIKASRGKYTVVKFQCSPGTVYDSEIETCNHPQNTKRSECRSSRPHQFITGPIEQFNDNEIEPAVHEIPSPITTRKPIYERQTSIPESPSTSTTLPSPIPIAIQSPAYGAYVPVNLVQSTIQAQTNEISKTTVLQTPMPSIYSTSHTQRTPPANQYGSTTTAARFSNECIHDGFMGDSEDCRKFYRCVNDQRGGFKKIEFMCSESTIWDDDIQSCNHPWAVRYRRCGRDTSYSDYSPKPDEYYSQKNYSLIEEQLSDFESNKTEIPAKLDLLFSTVNSISYGEQTNVDKNMAWIDKSNVSNTILNSQERQTYYPIVEKENDYITQSYETVTKTSSYVPEVALHDTSYNANPPNYKVQNNACTESGFMGDSHDCRKFYRCVENGRGRFIKHEFQCGEGTAWDKNIESCNHVWMVKDCSERGISNSFTSERNEPENKHTTLSNTIKDVGASDNNGYNNWDNIEKQNISRPTTVMPVVTQILEEPSKLNESQEMCNSVGFMANRNNCKIFYRCVENSNGGFTKFGYLCGDGTAWDPSIEACNHIGQVKHCGPNIENQTMSSTGSTEPTITTVSFVQTTVELSGNKPSPLPPLNNDEHLQDNQSNDINRDPIRTTESTTVVNMSNVTVTSSNKINFCVNSGFIGDNLDCKKFYRCVSNGDGSYKQYEFSCGEGTLWDPEIEACNHAWAVKKCGGSTYNHNEISTSRSTTTLKISNEFESGYPTQGYDQTQVPIHNTVDISTSSVPVSDKGLQCQSAGFMSDKNDCKRFYRCVENGLGGFDRFEFSCGEGTVWDSDIQACNHASSVKDCGTPIYNTTTSSLVESTQSTAIVPIEVDKNLPGSETESSTTIKIQYTNNTCKSDGFYGDEYDCKKFYRCVQNQQGDFMKYEFSCGEGTLWDQNIQACNHASTDSAKCKGSTETSVTTAPLSVTPSREPVSTEINNTLHPDENSTQENNDITDVSNTCSAEGFYPNSRDCKKFFRCVKNGKGYIRYDFICGEGTIWVQDIQACDHDSDNSTCSTIPITENEVISSTQATSSHTDTGHSEVSKTTESTDASTDRNTQSVECHSEGYYGKADDCRQFYRCVRNEHGTYTKYDYICSEGTAWDVDKLSCNHIDLVKRCQPTSVQDVQSTTVKQYEEESKTTEAIMPTKSTTLTAESTSIKEDASNIAECNSEGYFGNQEDCQKFYRCVNDGKSKFVRYDYICGEGTIWDQDILTCNHPRDVINRSCDKKSTSASSPENTEASTQSTTSAPSSTQSSSTPSMVTQSTTSSMTTQTATTSTTTQTETSSIPTQTATTSTSTKPATSSTTQTATSSMTTPHATSTMQTATSSITTQTATSVTPTQTTTYSSTTESTTSSNEGSSQETPISSGEETSKNPTNKNITCTKAGFYPHPSDCKKFYRCVDWNGDGSKFSVFHFECGEGTIWDPSLNTCNYEESVYPPRNCNATQSQVNNTSQTTTTAQTTTTESSTPIQSSSETTSTQSTIAEAQTTDQQTSTSQTSTSTTTPTDTTSTTMITMDTSSTTVPPTESTSTTVKPTDTTSTSSDQTTSQQSTTDTTTTQRDQSTTTTVDTSTTDNTSSTSEQTTMTEQTSITTEATTSTIEQTTVTEQTSTTTEATTSTTEQQTSTTLEQSSTEQPTAQTTLSATEQTTSQGSTTEQQTSTDSSTEVTNTSTSEATSTSTESTTENTEATTTQGSSTGKDCPDTEDDQYLYACPTSFKRHPKYCNLFYQCIENNDNHELKIATFNCPNGTIYDESKIQCVEESQASKKCQGAIAKNRRIKRLNLNIKEMITVNQNKYGCTGEGHFPFEKNEECSPAILKCEISKRGKLQGFVYRCPDNYVYWSVSRRCEPILRMASCKHSSNQWIGRSEIPIETKNIA